MKIVFAGGGTGGHLFPGIAIAQALPPQSRILFLCTSRPFDRSQLERYKFEYHVLPSPRLPAIKKPWTGISFIINILLSLYKTFGYFARFKPDVVIGLGGYGAFSSLIIARLTGVPLVLLEQNVLPGRISRLFAPWARNVFCQWAKSLGHLRNRPSLAITGSPVRKEILAYINHDKITARKALGLTKQHIVLVIGGSQGAGPLNKSIINNMEHLRKLSGSLGVIHLTGAAEYQNIKDVYEQAGVEHLVKPFSDDMGLIYAASDLALSRAGGIAIAEMTLFGLPMLLVPYPQAADNHQFFNARDIHQQGAGILVRQAELDWKIAHILDDIGKNGFKSLAGMALKARSISKPNAATEIMNSLSDAVSG